MKDIILSILVGTVITWLFSTLDLFHLNEEPLQFDEPHKITVSSTIGCLTQESLQEISQNFINKDMEEMKKKMELGLCVLLSQNTELFLQKDVCAADVKNSKIFLALIVETQAKLYMTCSVVR